MKSEVEVQVEQEEQTASEPEQGQNVMCAFLSLLETSEFYSVT